MGMPWVKAYPVQKKKFPDYTEGDDANFEKLEKDFFPSGSLLLQLLYQQFCLSWDSDTTSHLHLKNEYDNMSIILFHFQTGKHFSDEC